MTKIIQHSSITSEHYTPEPFIEAARELMGEIDLDPATTAEVNEKTIKAVKFFTKEDDSLFKDWAGRVWLNPPGSVVKDGNKRVSAAATWFNKLATEYKSGRVQEGLFLAFNLEALKNTQSIYCSSWIGEYPLCFPRQRIPFLNQQFEPQKQPSHANVIAYLPQDAESIEEFARIFSKFGRILIPRQ